MKPRISLTLGRKIKWLAPLVALLLMAGAAGAAERLLIPEDMESPFYTRGLGHTDDGYVIWPFYRGLDNIPDDIVVSPLTFYDEFPEDCPLLVEGFAIMKPGSVTPIFSQFRNRPGELVPIAFAYYEDYFDDLADGKVTAEEVRNMPSLKVAWADSFLQVFQPFDPEQPQAWWHITVVASGPMEDGSPFFLRVTHSYGAFNVEFRVGD